MPCLKESLALAADVLQGGQVPPLDPGMPRQTLSVPQRALLIAALEDVEPGRVRAEIERCLARGYELAALWMLGAVGHGPDFERLVLGLESQRVSRELDPGFDVPLRAATAAILVRDPDGFVWLESAGPRAHSSFLPPLLLGLGDAADPRGLGPLAALLSRRPECYELAVTQVRRVGRGLDAQQNEEVARLVLARLHTAAPGLAQEALRAVGALRACGAAEKLVELLEDDERGTREAAHWGLRALSGKPLGPEPEPWRAWYEREREHLQASRPACALQLGSSTPGRQAAAIKEIGRRELFQEEWAALLVDYIAPGPELDALRCRALGELGAVGAVDCLLGRVGDELVLVRVAASNALASITGLPAPDDPRDWPGVLPR
jgi:hypothetical protein